LKSGRFAEAKQACEKNQFHPLQPYLSGNREKEPPRGTPREGHRTVGNRQVRKMEKYRGTLVSINGIEPLLVFLVRLPA
jgi:hypothetical protein